MNFKLYKYLILSDLYRVTRTIRFNVLLKQIFFGEAYKYIFWMRTCNFLRSSVFLKFSLYPFSKIILKHYKFKFGIDIPLSTKIDSGFYIGHFGGIVINGNSKIGKNVNISPGVVLGRANRGKRKGFPVLGDNIYIAPGVKIVGAIHIGNNVAIGANSVVTSDIPENTVVAGIPARVISQSGAAGYVNKTDYESILKKNTNGDFS